MDCLQEMMEKITLTVHDIGTKEWVHITHINNPSSFYVRPKWCLPYLATLEVPGQAVKANDVQVKSTVCFMSKIMEKYIRGDVYFIESQEGNTTYDLLAIDYGFLEKSVDLKDVYKLNSIRIPPLAFHCELAACKPMQESWTDREIDAMKFYIGTEPAYMLVTNKTPETLTVRLFNSSPDDIATLMALTGYSHMGFGDNEMGRLTAPVPQQLYFKFKEVNIGDVLKVRLQSGKELDSFYVAEKQDYKTYLNEQGNFTYFTKKLKEMNPDDLKEGIPVAVLTDTYKYERGIVKNVVSENRANVQLIDWGKINEYHISSIKPMSEKFYYNPAVAIYCSVDKEQLSDYQLLKYMYPGYEFSIKIKEIGDQFSTPNIVEILRSK